MLGTRFCRPPTRCRPRQIHVDALFVSFGCFRRLPGITGLSRSIEAAKRHGKKTGYAYGAPESIRIFLEHRVDAAVPGAVEFFQELFGGRNTARDVFLNRAQIASLVLAASVQPPTPRKSLLRQRHRCLGEMQHVVPRDPSREA